MVERDIQIDAGILIPCDDCHLYTNKKDKASCPLAQFEEEFNASEKTPTALNKIIDEQGLRPQMRRSLAGVPHIVCPTKKGLYPGLVNIFVDGKSSEKSNKP